jgi:hypothetical protein
MEKEEETESSESKIGGFSRKFALSIIIGVVTGLICTIITSYIIYHYNTTMYPQRYEDASLVEDIEKELSDSNGGFIITQMGKANLHGLDHVSLIVCGYISSQEGVPYAKLALYEKPAEDYNSVLRLSPVEMSAAWLENIAFKTEDLNADEIDELIVNCYTSSELPDQYVAVISWFKDYRCSWTVPVLEFWNDMGCLRQLLAAGIDIFGLGPTKDIISLGGLKSLAKPSISLALEQSSGQGVQETNMEYTSFCEIRNVDYDPFKEILCADLVRAEGEALMDDHACFLRVYEMSGTNSSSDTATIHPDPNWNGGKPLLWTQKCPVDFQFTNEMIDAGRPGWMGESAS